MMEHRHDEFSIHVTWKQPERGSYPRVSVPGYYLTAGWSNEGAADYPIDNFRLTDNDLLCIASAVDTATGCDGTFYAATERTVRQASDAIEKRKARLRESIAAQQAVLSALEHDS